MQQEVTLRALRQGDVDWLTRAHGRLYARDEGFDASFETLVGQVLADFLRDWRKTQAHDPRKAMLKETPE